MSRFDKNHSSLLRLITVKRAVEYNLRPLF